MDVCAKVLYSSQSDHLSDSHQPASQGHVHLLVLISDACDPGLRSSLSQGCPCRRGAEPQSASLASPPNPCHVHDVSNLPCNPAVYLSSLAAVWTTAGLAIGITCSAIDLSCQETSMDLVLAAGKHESLKFQTRTSTPETVRKFSMLLHL